VVSLAEAVLVVPLVEPSLVQEQKILEAEEAQAEALLLVLVVRELLLFAISRQMLLVFLSLVALQQHLVLIPSVHLPLVEVW
jgi:hypothetical protein